MSVLTDMAYCVGPKAAHGDGNACFLGTHRRGLSIPGSGKRYYTDSTGIRAWAAGLAVDYLWTTSCQLCDLREVPNFFAPWFLNLDNGVRYLFHPRSREQMHRFWLLLLCKENISFPPGA